VLAGRQWACREPGGDPHLW